MITAFILILIHHVADFMFQTSDMALGKSKKISKLLKHTITYTSVFFVFFVISLFLALSYAILMWDYSLQDFSLKLSVLWFFPITFVCHTITDYISSRITSKMFEKQIYYTGLPNFGVFAIINIDQMLHYAQLFLTYYYLTTN